MTSRARATGARERARHIGRPRARLHRAHPPRATPPRARRAGCDDAVDLIFGLASGTAPSRRRLRAREWRGLSLEWTLIRITQGRLDDAK